MSEFADGLQHIVEVDIVLGLSGVVLLLRVTLAVPVRVATLPIGSSTACCASDAGAAVELGAAGCACAKTLGVPTTVQQATQQKRE